MAFSGTVTKKDFVANLAKNKGAIDLSNLSADARTAFHAAGVSDADLAKLAGKDGKISGKQELGKLFDLFDRADGDPKVGRIQTLQVGVGLGPFGTFAPTVTPTKEGAALFAMKAEVDAHRALANAQSGSKDAAKLARNHGVIDTLNLSPGLKTALKAVHVTDAELKAVAGNDGQIKGEKEMKALHALLDGKDGTTDGFVTKKEKQKDASVKTTDAGAAYEAIEAEVAKNRKEARYQAPGTKSASTQTALTIAANAETVPVAARKPEVNLGADGINQFDLYPDDPDKGGKACFEAASTCTKKYLEDQFGNAAPKQRGPDQVIQAAYREDKNGRVVVDADQMKRAHAYIDLCLDKGYPVTVGVSYSDANYNHDKMTDHFLTIDRRGYDDAGRLFYEFKDPGDGGRVGRFYVDKDTGKFFKEGDHKDHYVKNLDYELTQVRTFEGVDLP